MNYQWQDELYQDPEDDFLSSYQLDHDCDWEKRLRRAKTANVLALWVRKEYREKLRSSGVLRKTLSHSKDTEFFRTIPVEIMLEVLEYLHPIDLLQLTKTDTTFRDLLKDRSSSPVWRSAFGNYPDIPKVPSNLTGYKWADLLFNPLICEKCGASPAPLLATPYQRRCGDCIHKEFISYDEYGSFATHLARKVQIIPTHPSVEDTPGFSQIRINRAELGEITSTVQRLENAIVARVPDAKEALERYKQERHELTTTSKAEYDNCLAWAKFYETMVYGKASSTVPSLLPNIKARFKRLGFKAADVDNAVFNTKILTNLVSTTGISRLGKRSWARLQPLLVPDITAATQIRVRRLRTDFVRNGYKDYFINSPPATWAYLPPYPAAVMQFDSVLRLINAPPDHGDPLVEKDVLKLLPQEVDNWTTLTMKQLASFLPSSSSCAVESTTSPDLNVLNLATSVFQCPCSVNDDIRAGGSLIGWDGVVPHLGCRELEQSWETKLHFSRRGHDVAKVLVRLLGLDPATTKVWEMDALDKRFVCLICPPTRVGRTAYTWQDAVYHHIERSKYNPHDALLLGLVGPEAEARVKSREKPEPDIWQHNWMCNHCPDLEIFAKPLAVIIEHAKDIHDISRPINNLDYVYFLGDRTYRKPVCVDECEFLCLRCASTKSRLYSWKGIRLHLKDSHGLSASVEHEYWKKINTILWTESTSGEQNKVQ